MLVLATACTTYSTGTYIGSDAYELARRTLDDGSVETYVVDSDAKQGIAVRQTIERDEVVADLGLRVGELDKATAERRGLRPFRGLLVRGLEAESAAGAAGVVVGDVVTSIDGVELSYETQFRDLSRRKDVAKPMTLRILRGANETEVVVTPKSRKQKSRDVVAVPLETSQPNKAYAGFVLRAIPQEWVERIHGDTRNGVLLAGVEVGSPAWLAGFRGGDRITAVDGGAVPTLPELARTIAERGAARGSIRLRVEHGEGPAHEAVIPLSDYQRTEQVHFPLVFQVVDGVVEDKFCLGPWGLLVSNRSAYVRNPSREVQTESSFDALLGLFHVRSTPDSSMVRLLWFIKIGSG
jgi:membrane-associated protease RseP (regulator of RpoE activity)